MINVAFFGYREWAYRIFQNLEKVKSPAWKITDVSKADVVLYYGWSWKIPEEMYKNKLCLILHTSPLPKYRGGSPLQHQIINGEEYSAITILKVEEKIDTGDIYEQEGISLKGSLNDIFDRIVEKGTKSTINVLYELATNATHCFPQDDSQATTYKRRKPEQSEITLLDFETKPAKRLYDFIRCLADPYPNAYIKCADGKKLYLTGARIDEDDQE